MSLQWDTDALQGLGETLRRDALANFDQRGVASRSGTLRQAVANAQIAVETSAEGFTVTVTLDDRLRTGAALGGPVVFRGHPVIWKPPVVYRRGGPVIYRSGGRQRGTEAGAQAVFTLSEPQMQAATDDAASLLLNAVNAALSSLSP